MDNRTLRLYVVGSTPSAISALEHVRRLCENHLHGSWKLEVIDVLKQPELAEADRISAVPALIWKSPRRMRRVVGDLSDHKRVLLGLGLGTSDTDEVLSNFR
jgi:circadian clock protein KaiB